MDNITQLHNTYAYDLIIIGGGTAGLSALKHAIKYTNKVLLVDDGPRGTTCALTGCMPYKSLINIANNNYELQNLEKDIYNQQSQIDLVKALENVRKQRNHFLKYIEEDFKELSNHIVYGKAVYRSANSIHVDDKVYYARSSVIATGSSQTIPKQFRGVSKFILTSDNIFEQKTLPQNIAVIGLGAIGLEMSQALSRLGINVTAISNKPNIDVVNNKQVTQKITDMISNDCDLWLGCNLQVKKSPDGKSVIISDGFKQKEVDALFLATGRVPNIKNLNLAKIGVPTDPSGIPYYNKDNYQISNFPIYIAGDANNDNAILHEASFEGTTAANYALKNIMINTNKHYSEKYVPLSIIFTNPQIAIVGNIPEINSPEIVTGEASFDNQGRAVIEGENFGLLTIYANKYNGCIIGAEMLTPDAEHFAHYLSMAITHNHTVEEALRSPFYHPTLFEGLKTALKNTYKKLEIKNRPTKTMKQNI